MKTTHPRKHVSLHSWCNVLCNYI